MGNDLGDSVRTGKISKDKMLQISRDVFYQIMFYNGVPLAQISEAVALNHELAKIIKIELLP